MSLRNSFHLMPHDLVHQDGGIRYDIDLGDRDLPLLVAAFPGRFVSDP
jgi:hypothetical protein